MAARIDSACGRTASGRRRAVETDLDLPRGSQTLAQSPASRDRADAAWRLLDGRYRNRLYWYARGRLQGCRGAAEEAADLVGETFTRLLTATVDPAQPCLGP